jgi:hypothetical protein
MELGESNMKLFVTLDLDGIRTEMKPVFTDKYKSDWVDENTPTDIELTNSLKAEVNAGLQYLGISFEITDS